MKGAEDDLSHLEFFIFSFRLSLFIYLFTIASNEMKKKIFIFRLFSCSLLFTCLFLYRKSLDHVIESNRSAGLVEAVNRHVVETHAHTNGTSSDNSNLTQPEIEGKIVFKKLD